MPIPFLTGLGRVLDTAVGPDRWEGVPGWETRTGFDSGYRDVYAAVIHTTESPDSAFAKAAAGDRAYRDPEAPTLDVVADRWGTRGAHTYNMLIARDGTVRLIGAGPGWQAGHGTWPTKVAGPNPGVRDGEANFHTIGISMDANSSKYPVTQAQLVTLVKILAQLKKDWAPDRFEIMMHGEWQPVGYPGAEGRTDPTCIPGGMDAVRAAAKRGTWDKPAQTRAASTAAVSYKVQKGDTLTSIGRRFGVPATVVAAQNKIPDPNNIVVGQELRIQPGVRVHVVDKGESFWGIGRRYGLTPERLAALNGKTVRDTIYPGDILRLA